MVDKDTCKYNSQGNEHYREGVTVRSVPRKESVLVDYFDLYHISVHRIETLESYISRLECERDYYRDACNFAGLPDTPLPYEVCNTRRER